MLLLGGCWDVGVVVYCLKSPSIPTLFMIFLVLSMVFYQFNHPVGENDIPDHEIAHLFSKRHKHLKYHVCGKKKQHNPSMNTCKAQLEIQKTTYGIRRYHIFGHSYGDTLEWRVGLNMIGYM